MFTFLVPDKISKFQLVCTIILLCFVFCIVLANLVDAGLARPAT